MQNHDRCLSLTGGLLSLEIFSVLFTDIHIVGMTTFVLSSSVYRERGPGNAYMQSGGVSVSIVLEVLNYRRV